MLLWVSAVAAFSWLVEASLLFGPYRSLLHYTMLVPLALSVVPLVASVPGAFKGRARIVRKKTASEKTSATTSVNTPADVRLVNPYGTRAYVKWLIPLLFVHGVFMLYAVFMLLLAQLRVEGAVPELTPASVVFWGALILVLMWVRYTMQRQALNDFAELEAARTAWKKTRDRQYLELMAAQSARILDENKALTKQACAHVQEYADFAAQKLGTQR